MEEDACVSNNIVETIIRRDQTDPETYVWDEWLFYENLYSFSKVYADFLSVSKTDAKTFDYVCSLGKSGFPLAAKLAYDLDKPLIISSLSEFIFQNRTFVLGLPPDLDIKGKTLFCVDSHTRTGGTIDLFERLIKTKMPGRVKYSVIFDCREGKASHHHEVRSLYRWKAVESSLLRVVPPARIKDPSFWMKEDRYWLTYVSLDSWVLGCPPEGAIPAPILALEESEAITLTEKGQVEPLRLFLQPDVWKGFTKRVLELVGDNRADTVVALSVAAIPLAFILSALLHESSPDKRVRFLFLMNEPPEYYAKRLEDSQGVLLCDDAVLTGGLLYAVHSLLLKGEKEKTKNIITIFDSAQFPEEGRKYLKVVLSDSPGKYIAALSK